MKKVWKDIKKQGLMDVAVKVLSREGLEGITMEAVALEAGVAKGTLYVYFKNKQELIKEAIDATILPMHEELLEILQSDSQPDQRLREMIFRHLAYFEKKRDFFRIFVHDRFASQRRLKRYQNGRYHRFLEATAAVIGEGIRLGFFRELDALKAAAMLVEADIAIINQRLLSEQPAPVEKDAALVSDVFLHGIQRTQ